MDYFDEYARPFLFEGNKEACLLIHGFTGTPGHMRYLGEFLHEEAGYTVKAPLLPGHGTSLKEMEKTGWQDWFKAVEKEYKRLVRGYNKVYVMGLSMGGVLSLLLAAEYEVDKVIPIAAPVIVHNKLIYFAPILKYFIRFREWGESEIEDKYDVGYSGFPVKCAEDLVKLIRKMKRNLEEVVCPILIVQSWEDKTVKPVSAERINKGVESSEKEIFWLKESGHVCTVDSEKEKIHRKILDFLQN